MTVSRIVFLLFVALAFGCEQKPDASVVLWDQPAPEIAAKLHAAEKGLVAAQVVGKSMQPLIVAGDWAVYDTSASFSSVYAGRLCVYAPDFAPNQLAVHMAATRSGDGWKMDGIGNANYDPGVMRARNFWGVVVKVYTKRTKA